MRPLAQRALRAALALGVAGLPRRRVHWGHAMLAEVDAIEDEAERLSWTGGALAAVLRTRLWSRTAPLWAAGVVAAGLLLAVLDQSPSDDAGQVVMAALLVTGAGLGFAAPGARLATGLLLGSVIAVAHASAGLGALTLLVLIVPATVAAAAGGAVRRRLVRPRR